MLIEEPNYNCHEFFHLPVISSTQFLLDSIVLSDYFSESKLEELKWLRKRLNKFFTAFVAEVVFSSETAPDEEIVEWLLKCVTFGAGTRQFSLYNTADVVDPTPVLRSFLLKLLLQCSHSDFVKYHLNGMLADWGEDERQWIRTMDLLMDIRKVV